MIPLILEPQSLSALMGQESTKPLLLVDLSSAENYSKAHLKDAIHIQPRLLVSGVKPAVGKLPKLDHLNQLFSSMGYHQDKHIVAYDDEGGGWAGRFIWTLDVIGHKNMSYLNGGIHAWIAAQLPTTRELPVIKQTRANLTIHTEFIATKNEILECS